EIATQVERVARYGQRTHRRVRHVEIPPHLLGTSGNCQADGGQEGQRGPEAARGGEAVHAQRQGNLCAAGTTRLTPARAAFRTGGRTEKSWEAPLTGPSLGRAPSTGSNSQGALLREPAGAANAVWTAS